MPSSPKRIIIIAGPNGAGKTTFARTFLTGEAELPRFINANSDCRGFGAVRPRNGRVARGAADAEEIARCVARRESFAFESTLSGLGYVARIAEWREAGYRVSLVFLSLPDADMAVHRVAARVREGGHDIPMAVIRRRFTSGLANLHTIFVPSTTGRCTTIVGPSRSCCNRVKRREQCRPREDEQPRSAPRWLR